MYQRRRRQTHFASQASYNSKKTPRSKATTRTKRRHQRNKKQSWKHCSVSESKSIASESSLVKLEYLVSSFSHLLTRWSSSSSSLVSSPAVYSPACSRFDQEPIGIEVDPTLTLDAHTINKAYAFTDLTLKVQNLLFPKPI